MNLLRFTAAWTGVAAAFLYLLALFLWSGSALGASHPWVRYLPISVAGVPWLAVTVISGWRLMSRTLPSGGGDLFSPKWSDFRYNGDWDLAAFGGCALAMVGALSHRMFGTSEFVIFAGFSLTMAGSSQRFWRVYEEGLDA